MTFVYKDPPGYIPGYTISLNIYTSKTEHLWHGTYKSLWWHNQKGFLFKTRGLSGIGSLLIKCGQLRNLCNPLLTGYVWWTLQRTGGHQFVTARGYELISLLKGKDPLHVKRIKMFQPCKTSYKKKANSIITQSVIFHCTSWH